MISENQKKHYERATIVVNAIFDKNKEEFFKICKKIAADTETSERDVMWAILTTIAQTSLDLFKEKK